ncbi:MAG: hydroxyisourate hydrolase [Candidatus Obscuribacterales bacterium]|nr:hydroxyisourate hydrolase [Candidatus Obscuribacterales bacterium]
MPLSPITTHILDTARGCPAAGVPLSIELEQDGKFVKLGQGVTNNDGRVTDLLPHDRPLESGRYRMRFETAVYFQAQKIEGFYPYVEIVFEIKNPSQHYHIPLLLSPFGYSTYRGS